MKIYFYGHQTEDDDAYADHHHRSRSTRRPGRRMTRRLTARSRASPYTVNHRRHIRQLVSSDAHIENVTELVLKPNGALKSMRTIQQPITRQEVEPQLVLCAPITAQRPPISRSQLASVIKGIWHLSKCKGRGAGCNKPICKAIRKLIHKIATHTCPNARFRIPKAQSNVPHFTWANNKCTKGCACNGTAAKEESVTSGASTRAPSTCVLPAQTRCRSCELWGYIMRAYLQAHGQAVAARAARQNVGSC